MDVAFCERPNTEFSREFVAPSFLYVKLPQNAVGACTVFLHMIHLGHRHPTSSSAAIDSKYSIPFSTSPTPPPDPRYPAPSPLQFARFVSRILAQLPCQPHPITLAYEDTLAQSVHTHIHTHTTTLPSPPLPQEAEIEGVIEEGRKQNHRSPLLVLRVLGADDVHVLSLLPAHALAPVAQLLDRRAHLHAARLLLGERAGAGAGGALDAEGGEACGEGRAGRVREARTETERRGAEGARGRRAERAEQRAAQGEEERSREHGGWGGESVGRWWSLELVPSALMGGGGGRFDILLLWGSGKSVVW